MAVKRFDYDGVEKAALRDIQRFIVNLNNYGPTLADEGEVSRIFMSLEPFDSDELRGYERYKLKLANQLGTEYGGVFILLPRGYKTRIEFHSTHRGALRIWGMLVKELPGEDLSPKPQQENDETSNQLKQTNIDAPSGQFGVVGDNVTIQGGIHFHGGEPPSGNPIGSGGGSYIPEVDEPDYRHRPIFQGQYPELETFIETAGLRDLLAQFSDEQITTLAFDRFEKAYRNFGQDMKTDRKRQILLEYCKDSGQLWVLAGQLCHLNRRRFVADFPQLVAPLLKQLESEVSNERVKAAKILGFIQEPVVVPFLEDQLRVEVRPVVASWLADAIGKIGGAEAKEALLRLQVELTARSAHRFTLRGIEQALKRIDQSG